MSTLPTDPRPTWIRHWYRGAAVYGVLILIASLAGLSADPAVQLTQLSFLGVAGTFQMMFWIIGSDPIHFHRLMPVTVLEKLAFGIPAILLAPASAMTSAVVTLATVDIILGAGFLRAWLCLREPLPPRRS